VSARHAIGLQIAYSKYDGTRALSKLDSVLPPFADAISKYTGMVAIVTLVGPSGEDGGQVVVRRLCLHLFMTLIAKMIAL
jgi:hypothetical protein